MNTLQRIERLNRNASRLCAQAERLEAIEEATRHVKIKLPLTDRSCVDVVERHLFCKHKARALRAQAQALLIEATNLTDYSFESDLKTNGWHQHLAVLAHEAKGLALSDRQVKSCLDNHYHSKAA